MPFGRSFVVNSEDPTEWTKEIQRVCSLHTKVYLEKAIELRKNYSETDKWEEQCSKLIEKILEVVGG